jgi:hypothetical protein
MAHSQSKEKSEILKEALKIIDALSESDLDGLVEKFTSDDFDYIELQNLIKRAKKLKNNRLWKLN